MKFLIRYSLPIMVVIYGIMLEEKLVTAVRGTGNGFHMIVYGILLLLFGFYLEYSNLKYDNDTIDNIKETKKLVDYFCLWFFIFGLICLGLFIFGVIINYFIFIGILATFMFCNKSMIKFL